MPLITFNERRLDLMESSHDSGDKIDNLQTLRAAIARFGASNEQHQSIAIAGNLNWKAAFTVWPTGGGAVRNEEGKYLLIRRLGWWDLPKGKLDPGESLEECAVREVREETGVEDLSIVKPLLITYHSYEERGMRILKENHWYLMDTSYAGRLKAQAEEDITEAIWATESELRERWDGMYRAVQDVLAAALSA
ncbi:MAG: NUDIX domain-containing protein [Chitinophagaceae bacterium]|nr:MAG: NUDIX domain-containing protein [Chitinophagaceae bacterium]